jgi:mannose-6-phosphate isomerase-like protein (cupin superfamily)
MSVKADASGTEGAFGLAEALIPFGHSPRLHVHGQEDEAFFVLEGAVEFVCGDERFRGEAGAFAFLPRGIPHSFLGVSEPAARALMLVVPGGLEEIFNRDRLRTDGGGPGVSRHRVRRTLTALD